MEEPGDAMHARLQCDTVTVLLPYIMAENFGEIFLIQ